MIEADFWAIHDNGRIVKKNKAKPQTRGIKNKALILRRKQNNQTQKIDYMLSKEDC
jgi:hypothetical protein